MNDYIIEATPSTAADPCADCACERGSNPHCMRCRIEADRDLRCQYCQGARYA